MKTKQKILLSLGVACILVLILSVVPHANKNVGGSIEAPVEENVDLIIADEPLVPEKMFESVADITPTRELTEQDKEKDFIITHGEAVIPKTKSEKVIVKDRYEDREVDIESRLDELEQIIKDAKANIDRTQGILDNASSEYEKLLIIYNK